MWFRARVKGAGAKPSTAHFYVEGSSEQDAESRAEDLGTSEFSLFGVRNVSLTPVDFSTDEDVGDGVSGAGGPNEAFKMDGSSIKR